MARLKDNLWLWGQDAGSHHATLNNLWKLPGVNRMGPAEGARYLGIKNMCRVVMLGEPEPPFDAESEKLTSMDKVIWSAMGDSCSVRNDEKSDLEEVLRQAERFPNVTGAILDDFFTSRERGWARHPVEGIREMRDRLHGYSKRQLDLWVVWYKQQLDFEVDNYLHLFDVITYWNMFASAQLSEIDDDIATVVRRTPGKRRMAGCYMWNYGEHKALTIPEIEGECEKYYNWIRKGDIQGIIFCSNCCADLGLEAVEWVRQWIKEVGDTEV